MVLLIETKVATDETQGWESNIFLDSMTGAGADLTIMVAPQGRRYQLVYVCQAKAMFL